MWAECGVGVLPRARPPPPLPHEAGHDADEAEEQDDGGPPHRPPGCQFNTLFAGPRTGLNIKLKRSYVQSAQSAILWAQNNGPTIGPTFGPRFGPRFLKFIELPPGVGKIFLRW